MLVSYLLRTQKNKIEIYFSYGASHMPIGTVSRFYVDLNVHIKTSGYAAGEVISLHIDGRVERALSAMVGTDGVAIVSGVLMDDRIDLEGEL